MSSTSKQRLNEVKEKLDHPFANCHSDDRLELVTDLREYLSNQRSAAKRPACDPHANGVTGHSIPS